MIISGITDLHGQVAVIEDGETLYLADVVFFATGASSLSRMGFDEQPSITLCVIFAQRRNAPYV